MRGYRYQDHHCYLDWLKNRGFLGDPDRTAERYSAGMTLRALWHDKDMAETRYIRIMRSMPEQHRATARGVALDQPQWIRTTKRRREQINAALDALAVAFCEDDNS